MALSSWILPTIIGLLCAIFLMMILYPETFLGKQRFSDLGALIQLETSRPYYYPAYVYVPDGFNANAKNDVNPNVTYTSPTSDLPVSYPIYNYYPQNPLNPPSDAVTVQTNDTSNNKNSDKAFVNQPRIGYNAHLAAYYGGYPYPLPMWVWPPTNIDNVKGVEDKI